MDVEAGQRQYGQLSVPRQADHHMVMVPPINWADFWYGFMLGFTAIGGVTAIVYLIQAMGGSVGEPEGGEEK
jgi:hypothetical protein